MSSSRGALIVTVTAFVLAAGALYAQNRVRQPVTESRAGLIVRSPEAAKRLFLSFDAAAADVYWMRAIQHAGEARHRPDSSFDRLEPFLELATTLDPRFNVAYRFGAILLAEPAPNGPGRPDRAIRLLQKGLAANPRRWEYAHDIGFVHYFYTGRFDLAAEWFGRAARVPGAPRWLAPLEASTRARGGDRRGARQLLAVLLEADEPYIRQTANRLLLQLQALDELDRLNESLDTYRARTGTYPDRLERLVESGLITAMPADPTGRPYRYSASDGRVELSPESGLLPLPQTLRP